MTDETQRDVLEREEEILVVDENGTTHTFEREPNGVTNGVEPVDTTSEMTSWLTENTSYFVPENIEFPVSVEYGHHLEDTIGLALQRKLHTTLDGVLSQNRISYPSISLQSYWEVEQNGNARLTHVEYNGVKYTPEE